jgi:hypothetical protein
MWKLWIAFCLAAAVAGCGARISPPLPLAAEQSGLPAMRPASFWTFSSFGHGFKYPLAVAPGPNATASREVNGGRSGSYRATRRG